MITIVMLLMELIILILVIKKVSNELLISKFLMMARNLIVSSLAKMLLPDFQFPHFHRFLKP